MLAGNGPSQWYKNIPEMWAHAGLSIKYTSWFSTHAGFVFSHRMYLVFDYLYINLHTYSCLKPNTVKKPNNFSDDYIMSQLKCTGIMETTRIRQCGFPTRLTFEDFQKRWALSSMHGEITVTVMVSIHSSTCGCHWVIADGIFECSQIYFHSSIYITCSHCVHFMFT